MKEYLQSSFVKLCQKHRLANKLFSLSISTATLLASNQTMAQTLAFPEAMGFGRYAPGARGASEATREVYVVNNLNDSGTGSFRDAVSKSGRVVVFAVGGLIKITSDIVVSSNVTILGQTAPGTGITVVGRRTTFTGANNTIARFIRIRYGGTAQDVDASGLANGANIIFDHVSFSWGTDEVFSINSDGKGTSLDNITLQNCIIAQGIHRHNHSASGLIQPPAGGKVSLIQNLYISNKTRNPKVKGINEFVNNVVYNWGNANRLGSTMNYGWSGEAYIMGGDSGGESFANIINNYFVSGPSTKPGTVTPFSRGNSNFNLYGAGNYFDGNQNGSLDGTEIPYDLTGYPTGDAAALLSTPFDYPVKTPKYSAQQAYQHIIDSVGACYPRRDQVDSLLVAEVASKGTQGYYVYVPSDLPFSNGGAGNVYNAKSPTDTDMDGLPDAWEDTNGLNKNDKTDALAMNSQQPSYMNIEVYANALIQVQPSAFVIPPDNLSLSASTEGEIPKSTISVSWKANTTNEIKFVLERSLNGTSFTPVTEPAANATKYSDINLNPNTTYYYRIKAVTADDESAYSPVVSVKTPLAASVNDYKSGDFRSTKSGSWSVADTWEVFDGTNWAAASASPGATNKAFISNGHIVTLAATTSVSKVQLDNGAVLKGSGSDRNLRVADSLINYGTVGSATSGERISFEGYKANGKIVVTGTGSYLLGAFLVNAMAETLEIEVDANLTLANSMRAYYSLTSGQTAGQDDDNVTITINAGKTVTMTGLSSNASYLHNNNTSTISAANFGNYTYTINGTLDMRNTSTSCIVPHNTLNRDVTVNVNGTWLTGNALRIVSAATTVTPGNSYFNIGANGLVDGAARVGGSLTTTNFVAGPPSGVNKYPFFNITGNGKLKRQATANGSSAFPVGADGIYSLVTITNGTTAGNYVVNATTADSYGKPAVAKQFTITPDFATAGFKTAISWTTADHTEGFDPASPVLYNYANGQWEAVTSTATSGREGTLALPYQITQTNLAATSGTFMVSNEIPSGTPVLPLNLLSFKAQLKNEFNAAVKLTWITANEVDTRSFAIERKSDKDFETIGTIIAKNVAGKNLYSFTDYTPLTGSTYYRLKMIDLDGKISFSKVEIINNSNLAFNVFPNPATATINIIHSKALTEASFEIVDLGGKPVLFRNVKEGEIQTPAIDVAALPKGIYLVRFKNGSETKTSKFVKE